MTAPARTMSDSSHHSESTRKRISKACDRCRLKKSKCNGDSPCSRCTADNAICVFGERKRAHDRVYPKGYVEMLEQQQGQLVAGLQETYRRLQTAKAWPGATLDEHEGRPLTHDILSALDIIHHKPDGQVHVFEEDPEKLQQRLIAQGAPIMQRRGSFSSDSDHSTTHSSHSHKRARSHVESPMQSPKSSIFRHSFDHQKPSRTERQSSRTSAPAQAHNPHRPSPLHTDSSELDQLQVFEEDALMSSFPWQDMQADITSSPDPQFTFPPNDFTNLNQWPDMTTANYAALFAQPGLPAGLDYTNMQQLQRDSLDADFGGFVPIGAS